MFIRWLRSVRALSENQTAARRARPVVPRLEDLEGREVPAALIASGLADPYGSTVGPGGDLYVTEGAAGRVSRINPKTGAVTTFASGLPLSPVPGSGVGAVDVAFLGRTAYVLVTLVAPDVGGSDVVGIYRVDGPNRFTVVADLGAWAIAHPPTPPFEVPSGAPIAMESYRGGFLVAEGHHNRILHVTLDGGVTEMIAFDNIVPTGTAVRGNTVYVAQAGPIPHLPEDGKVVAFRPGEATATAVAAGARLLVDVEFGPGNSLYALSQGVWNGSFPGEPPDPDTGALVRFNKNGSFSVVEGGLDRPSSLEFIGKTAYVVNLAGEVWRFDDVSGPPFGRGAMGGASPADGGMTASSPVLGPADALGGIVAALLGAVTDDVPPTLEQAPRVAPTAEVVVPSRGLPGPAGPRTPLERSHSAGNQPSAGEDEWAEYGVVIETPGRGRVDYPPGRPSQR